MMSRNEEEEEGETVDALEEGEEQDAGEECVTASRERAANAEARSAKAKPRDKDPLPLVIARLRRELTYAKRQNEIVRRKLRKLSREQLIDIIMSGETDESL